MLQTGKDDVEKKYTAKENPVQENSVQENTVQKCSVQGSSAQMKASADNGRRVVGLDIFRILAALFAFLFHSNIHFECNYGILNEFVSMGAIFMTGFFMLSGYVLFLVYSKKTLTELGNIKNFC